MPPRSSQGFGGIFVPAPEGWSIEQEKREEAMMDGNAMQNAAILRQSVDMALTKLCEEGAIGTAPGWLGGSIPAWVACAVAVSGLL
ncbi:hypothetical protein RM533_13380 [Croceicoccus sp. F390]|uniref:Uncharacterized protein n=1 Tax=Croceicoccus esteveae TaxID=3075597 RepID=A0ABU2ZP09_9SPHN|nr:hypothetical protein [Croceicoccus sp. F390]MDT0577157.1 hypothetical protein [Croceicoccus sp. F390]